MPNSKGSYSIANHSTEKSNQSLIDRHLIEPEEKLYFPLVPFSGPKRRILIVTQARSGSTFLESLLQQSDHSIGMHEPIRFLREKLQNNRVLIMELVKQHFECDFTFYLDEKRRETRKGKEFKFISDLLRHENLYGKNEINFIFENSEIGVLKH